MVKKQGWKKALARVTSCHAHMLIPADVTFEDALADTTLPEHDDEYMQKANTIVRSDGTYGAVYYDGKGDAVAVLLIGESGITGVMVKTPSRGYGTALYDYLQDHTRINIYEVIGKYDEFTQSGLAFACRWLIHRVADM